MRKNVAVYQNKHGFKPYGAAEQLWNSHDPEVIISGAYETGKTRPALEKLHAVMIKYPKARGLMIRKTYKSLCTSACMTFENKVLPIPPKSPNCPIQKYGGEKAEIYFYPNGSQIDVAGLDYPDKVLSAEYDMIYVNQCEELTLNDWEVLAPRCTTGRAGNVKHPQIIGDCNPSHDKHWILQRHKDKMLKLLYSKHQDNPTLFNPETGEWTEQGQKAISRLKALTGIRYKRGYLGQWVAAEGQVYGFDPSIHMLTESELKARGVVFQRYIAGVDWGFTNPGVIAIYGVDYDGRLYRIRETYRTGKRIAWWVARAKAYQGEYAIDTWVCDPSAPAYIDDFDNAGLNAVAADNDIESGISAVDERLKVADDGQPRLFFLYDGSDEIDPDLRERHKPLSTEDEFPSYVYPSGKEGKNKGEKPVPEDDHGLDQCRYVCKHLHNQQFVPKSVIAYGSAKGW